MSEERALRIGRNEALYRQVNERIEDINDAFGAVADDFAIICECGELTCMEQITVSREVYETTRSNPARFIIVPGHEVPDVEEIVAREARYHIVEKDPGPPRAIAEDMDPRS